MAIKITVMPLDIDPEAKPVVQVMDKEEITIGRLPSNDIVLNRPEVSGIHARVRIEGNTFSENSKLYITDLGSSNGTMVEKNPLRPRVEVAMMPNERIFIGNYVLKPSIVVEENTLEEPKVNEGTTEIRRNYLSEALKEYEAGKIKADNNKEIEARIDRFAEERAVANSSFSPNKGYLNSIITEDSSESRDISYSNNNQMGGYFKNVVEDVEPAPQENVYKTMIDKKDFSDEPLEELKNPIAQAFNKKSQPQLNVEDLTDKLSIKVKVGSGETTTFNFNATAYTAVRGKILHKGKPLIGVKVDAGELGEIVSDAEGCFEFLKILEGTAYNLNLSKDKFKFDPSTLRGTTDLDSEELVVYATQLFTISGIINHQGKPLAGVTVDGGILGKVVTGPDGSYSFYDVPEDQEYDLTLYKDGFAFAK